MRVPHRLRLLDHVGDRGEVLRHREAVGRPSQFASVARVFDLRRRLQHPEILRAETGRLRDHERDRLGAHGHAHESALRLLLQLLGQSGLFGTHPVFHDHLLEHFDRAPDRQIASFSSLV